MSLNKIAQALAERILKKSKNVGFDPEDVRLAKLFVAGANGLDSDQLLSILSSLINVRRGSNTEVQIVVTAPSGFSLGRDTKEVIFDLIDNAKNYILVCGYHVSDDELLTRLKNASDRGLSVEIMADGESDRRAIEAFIKLNSFWQNSGSSVSLYRSKPPAEACDFYKAHPKVLVVDGERILIGSANFTWSGLNSNIEIGLLVNGPIAAQIKDVLRGMVLNLYERVNV